jgi:hypothetical protein
VVSLDFAKSVAELRESLAELKIFKEEYPAVKIYFSHSDYTF